MEQSVGTAGKINFEFLLHILNPALFVILAGGLILGFDLAPLIIVGIVGYAIWGILNIILHRKKRKELLANQRGKNKIKAPFDYGLIASFLNPAVLFVLIVGVVKGWDLLLLVSVGALGYGLWFFLNYKERRAREVLYKNRRRR